MTYILINITQETDMSIRTDDQLALVRHEANEAYARSLASITEAHELAIGVAKAKVAAATTLAHIQYKVAAAELKRSRTDKLQLAKQTLAKALYDART